MRRLYYWVHHTGCYDSNTGVQRVARALGAVLTVAPDVELIPVRWCAEREAIVRAECDWLAGLSRYGGPVLPEPIDAGEPLHLAQVEAGRLEHGWLLVPEVPHVAGDMAPALPVVLDYARYHGLRTAIMFYDLIPLRVPGYEPMRQAHASYALSLAAADLVLPISRSTSADLSRDSDEGAENWACMASLIETCKLNSVNPQVYITELLTRLVNGWFQERIDELMPWNWVPKQPP